VDIVNRDRRSVRAEGGDGGVAEPDGFFDQSSGAVVLAQEVPGFVIRIEDGAVDAAGDLDPLAEGVVEGILEVSARAPPAGRCNSVGLSGTVYFCL